ncbi:hypothetical protein [Streptomyces sp. YIM S03343]
MSPFLDSPKKPLQHQTTQVSPERTPPRRGRRPAVAVRTLVVVLLALVVGAVSVSLIPAVRHELRSSFTRLPSSYTELYFTSAPAVGNSQVSVPVSVVGHGAGARTYQLRVWLESPIGRTAASTTATLTGRPGARTSTVAHLPLRRGPAVVHVALRGHPESLQFRLGSPISPTPKGSP